MFKGGGEWWLECCACRIGSLAMPRLTCHFSPPLWTIWGEVTRLTTVVVVLVLVGDALHLWAVLTLVYLPMQRWGCCRRTFQCDRAGGLALLVIIQAILGAALLALDLNLWNPYFYSFLVPNSCGHMLVIGLTIKLGANDMFHLSTLSLIQVLTHPWILYIVGCLLQVCIHLLVAGKCWSVAWANLLVWVPGQSPGWCWCCWVFL